MKRIILCFILLLMAKSAYAQSELIVTPNYAEKNSTVRIGFWCQECESYDENVDYTLEFSLHEGIVVEERSIPDTSQEGLDLLFSIEFFDNAETEEIDVTLKGDGEILAQGKFRVVDDVQYRLYQDFKEVSDDLLPNKDVYLVYGGEEVEVRIYINSEDNKTQNPRILKKAYRDVIGNYKYNLGAFRSGDNIRLQIYNVNEGEIALMPEKELRVRAGAFSLRGGYTFLIGKNEKFNEKALSFVSINARIYRKPISKISYGIGFGVGVESSPEVYLLQGFIEYEEIAGFHVGVALTDSGDSFLRNAIHAGVSIDVRLLNKLLQ